MVKDDIWPYKEPEKFVQVFPKPEKSEVQKLLKSGLVRPWPAEDNPFAEYV